LNLAWKNLKKTTKGIKIEQTHLKYINDKKTRTYINLS
jgi:hypothetical protein